MYSFQMVRFERAVLFVLLLVRVLAFNMVAFGFGSPMAFSNAARTECSVDPAYTGRLSSV